MALNFTSITFNKMADNNFTDNPSNKTRSKGKEKETFDIEPFNDKSIDATSKSETIN